MGTAIENEFKFTTDRELDEDVILGRIKKFLNEKGIAYTVEEKDSTDAYYDTDGLDLYRTNRTLRMKRKSDGSYKLTAKEPVSNAEGVMSRKETEKRSNGSFEDLVEFVKKQMPDISILERPSLTLETHRVSIGFDNVDLAFDRCIFFHDGDSKTFHEIELELVSGETDSGFDNFGLAGFVEDELQFERATESKYHRGIDWIRTADVRRG